MECDIIKNTIKDLICYDNNSILDIDSRTSIYYVVECVHFGNSRTYKWKADQVIYDNIKIGSIIEVENKEGIDLVKVVNKRGYRKFTKEYIDNLRKVVNILRE